MLISTDYKDSHEAVESMPANDCGAGNDTDKLVFLFEHMDVGSRTCQVCRVEYVCTNLPTHSFTEDHVFLRITQHNRAEKDSKHCADCSLLSRKGLSYEESGLP